MGAQRQFPGSSALGILVMLLSAHPIAAQTTGSITGRVLDGTGAPLSGVTIAATSTSLPGIRTTATGPDGRYWIPSVPPGEYRVRASLSGFRSADKFASVRLDATATADFTLGPAAAEE